MRCPSSFRAAGQSGSLSGQSRLNAVEPDLKDDSAQGLIGVDFLGHSGGELHQR
jgi:hypothetical protein